MMSAAEIIKKACSTMGVSLSEVARRTDQLPSTLSRKLSRNTVSFAELQKCLAAIGVSLDFTINYPGNVSAGQDGDSARLEERIAILEAQHSIDKKNLEFHWKLARDIRTETENLEGYRVMALSHIGEQYLTEKYIKKAGRAISNIENAVAHSLGESRPLNIADTNADFSVLKGKKVLIADDNEMNREIMKELLTEYGLVVFEAKNGFEAVAHITAAEPAFYDYLVLDMEMPVMGGCEAARKIRALPNRLRANIPIIAATAGSSAENRLEAMDSGVDEFLIKPVNTKLLLSVFCRYL